ncbi:hypothetical protein Cadr_000017049 [Camelus dromedarius]|uniref:Uncharacterized protein n=1 Tax=Camelus dromedarius TaxID=9838 RepID=A0A5N4DGT4_CAMDR|nr:hypothetical protein Cadr_000017049 [Camelus dromedarius]
MTILALSVTLSVPVPVPVPVSLSHPYHMAEAGHMDLLVVDLGYLMWSRKMRRRSKCKGWPKRARWARWKGAWRWRWSLLWSLELEVEDQEEADPTEAAQKVVQEKELEALLKEEAEPDQEVEDLVDRVGLEDLRVDVVESEICPHQEQPLENGPVLYHLVEMLHVNCLLEDQLYLPQTFVLIA